MKIIDVYEKVGGKLILVYHGEERRDHEAEPDLRYVGKADKRNYYKLIIPSEPNNEK